MIQVYQLNAFSTQQNVDAKDFQQAMMFGEPEACKRLFTIGHYTKVAELATDNMNKAFDLTNSIDTPWVFNEGVQVQPAFKHGCRSTSVGDVLVKGDHKYVIAGVGFKPL